MYKNVHEIAVMNLGDLPVFIKTGQTLGICCEASIVQNPVEDNTKYTVQGEVCKIFEDMTDGSGDGTDVVEMGRLVIEGLRL